MTIDLLPWILLPTAGVIIVALWQYSCDLKRELLAERRQRMAGMDDMAIGDMPLLVLPERGADYASSVS